VRAGEQLLSQRWCEPEPEPEPEPESAPALAATAEASAQGGGQGRGQVGLVVCGDTNIFRAGGRAQRSALLEALQPLRSPPLRAEICEGSPSSMQDTHFFARADEAKWPQQAAVALGRLGVDLPGVFDIVATNRPVLSRHHWTIRSSDHDCVAATIQMKA